MPRIDKFIDTESRLVGARASSGETETASWVLGLFLGWWKYSGVRQWWWLYNTGNVLKATELHMVNFTSIKKEWGSSTYINMNIAWKKYRLVCTYSSFKKGGGQSRGRLYKHFYLTYLCKNIQEIVISGLSLGRELEGKGQVWREFLFKISVLYSLHAAPCICYLSPKQMNLLKRANTETKR